MNYLGPKNSYFGGLSPRMADFRENLLNAKPYVCAERAKITTETYRKNLHQPMVLRRAEMYKNILEGMTIYIEPETLLAGNQASSNRSAPIFPEYAMDWVIAELDQFDKR
ncbi:MAG: formate C-acetyltransferase/glycerol dehydratase family glycyl radical enzyme, partial [Spirochaetaceae bacterium]|nr:formate C-acetyltransferase/glycerol dehydratase family glycyl radical enzyme [Spirochaetaceae bacterium]